MLSADRYIPQTFTQCGEKHVCSRHGRRAPAVVDWAEWNSSSLVLIFVVFYFLLSGRSRKRQKCIAKCWAIYAAEIALTNGGLMGITRVPNETELIVEVRTGLRSCSARDDPESLSKSEPAPGKSKKDQTEDEHDREEAEDNHDEDDSVDIEEDKKTNPAAPSQPKRQTPKWSILPNGK